MRTIEEIILKTLIITLLLLFVVITSYFSNFILYNNQSSVIEYTDNLEFNNLKADFAELKKLTAIESENYIIGRVITRSLHNFYSEVIINVGAKNNIAQDDAVVNENGLIGIISKVEEDHSYVKLLTGNYNVSVRINDTYGNLNQGKVTLLDKYSNINEGDKIYTSGYSGTKKDIYIGTITKVKYDSDNLGKEVTVQLIDNKNLNYIAVIRGTA